MTRTIDRRRMLLAGLCSAVAGAPGARAAAADEPAGSGGAYAPWRDWRAEGAGPRHLVGAAILAANAHDTQPWLFCPGADRIDVLADERRNLGAMDPFRREMQLSLGCAVENLVVAASAAGSAARVAVMPGALTETMGGPRPVARLDLEPGRREASPLAVAIARRHTNRAAYDRDRPLGDAFAPLQQVASPDDRVRLVWLGDAAQRADFAAATLAATEAIVADPAMIGDSDAWFRASEAEVEAHRDGTTLAAAGLSPFTLFLARLLPSLSPERAHRAWVDQTKETQLASAAGFGAILVRDLYDREQALAAGRLWQRLHLTAATLGVAMQPMNQLPERVDRERQVGSAPVTARTLAGLLRAPGGSATFAFRFGWPLRAAPASPRRDLAAVIAEAGCRA